MEKPNSFYLKYSNKITREIFEVFQMWIEKNKTGLENRNYCDNTFEKFVQNKYDELSEYEMPSDFECVQEINHFTQLNKNKKESRVEKLFIL